MNYSYFDTSPCIDAGDPSILDSDGSVSDIGANIFSNMLPGDCNDDATQNVIDIVYNLNNCILEVILDNCQCTDLNNDSSYNVLDIVLLVNIILN